MKVFLDCGYYVGQVHKYYPQNWKTYAWEANPKLEVPDWVERKAVWVADGRVKFQLGGRNDASSIVGTTGHGTPELVTVPSFDFSKFVADLPESEAIVCSMDIEGAEFPVLRKMIVDGSAKRLTLLDVEFHHRIMVDETPESAEEIIRELENMGVIVRLKVELY